MMEAKQPKTQTFSRTSAERFKDIINAMSDGIVLIGLDGKVIDCNQATLKQLNLKRKELIGKVIMDFMVSKNKDNFIKETQDILRNTGKAIVETQALRKNDSPLPVEISLTRFYDKNKNPIGLLGVARDITERKRIEEELHNNRELLQSIIDSTDSIVIARDLNEKLILLNEKLAKTYNLPKDKALGTTPYDIYSEKVADQLVASDKKVLSEGKSFRYEETIPLGDISRTYFTNKFPLKDSRGRIYGVGGVITDITERKKAEEALKESERLYRAVFDNSEDGFELVELIYDETGKPIDERIVGVNQAFEKNTGLKMAELLGKKISELNPNRETRWSEAHYRVLRTGKPEHVEAYVNYTQRYYGAFIFPYSATAVGILFSDITERKKAEEALKVSEDRYRKLFNSMAEMFFVAEPVADNNARIQDFIYIDANEAFVKASGKPKAQIIGKKQNELFGIVEAYWLEVIEKVLRTEQPVHTEVKSKLTGNSYDVSMWKINNNQVGIIYLDVTNRKALEKQLQDNERLVAIGQTAGMVGHDIRNPLQAVMSDTYLIKDELSSMPECQNKEGIVESIDSIERNVAYINKIVLDLQDYARPVVPEFSIVNLSDVLVNVFETVHVPESIKLLIDIKDSENIEIDSTLLQRVITNIANNAIQAMPKGGTLTITGNRTDNKVVVTVSDTGTGIPDEVKPKLFTPMMTTKAKGQGFGLAVSKRLIEAMNGTINFESEQGKGTIFMIELPITQ